MSRGLSNAGIGKELFLSEDTVKTHARRLFRKLGAADRAQAVALGFRWGFLHQPDWASVSICLAGSAIGFSSSSSLICSDSSSS